MTKRKGFLLLLSVVVILAVTTGAAWAMSSASYQIPSNSLQGGGAGGGVASSTNYEMSMTFGGALQVSNSSASYEQCNGFLCKARVFIWSIYLPLLTKN